MTFLRGFLLGMTLQLSIGPVCLAVLHTSVTRGFREALKMAWGVALVDGAYILASLLGMAALLSIAIVKTAAVAAGALVLIFFGSRLLIPAPLKEAERSRGRKNSFVYGITLTLANPLTIVFWSSLFGSMIASGKLHGTADTFTYSSGCVTATILFLASVAAGGNCLSGILNENRIRFLNMGVGLFLIGFGLSMLVPLIRITVPRLSAVLGHFVF